MSIPRLVNFAEFAPSGDTPADLKRLCAMIEKELDNIRSRTNDGATGTIASADTPPKTVTIEKGVVKKIA